MVIKTKSLKTHKICPGFYVHDQVVSDGENGKVYVSCKLTMPRVRKIIYENGKSCHLNGQYPTFLIEKEKPDKHLLAKVKELVCKGFSIKKIATSLKISNYIAGRYYWKIKKKCW